MIKASLVERKPTKSELKLTPEMVPCLITNKQGDVGLVIGVYPNPKGAHLSFTRVRILWIAYSNGNVSGINDDNLETSTITELKRAGIHLASKDVEVVIKNP